jgi:hypothetical protein
MVLELHELDEINSKIGFVNGVLEFLRNLSSNDLLERIEGEAVSSLVVEAQEKLERVHDLLNRREDAAK